MGTLDRQSRASRQRADAGSAVRTTRCGFAMLMKSAVAPGIDWNGPFLASELYLTLDLPLGNVDVIGALRS
jgi:hypothetical protein